MGDLAYLGSSWSGLSLADVSSPSAPVEVGRFSDPKFTGMADGVAVAGNLAYIAGPV